MMPSSVPVGTQASFLSSSLWLPFPAHVATFSIWCSWNSHPSPVLFSHITFSPLKHPSWLHFIQFTSLHLRPICSPSPFDSFSSSLLLFSNYWQMNLVNPLDFFSLLNSLFLSFHSSSLTPLPLPSSQTFCAVSHFLNTLWPLQSPISMSENFNK